MSALATATTFLGATDAFFDGIEGNRTFDDLWGAVTCAVCLAVAAPMIYWIVAKRPISYFGAAVDRRGWLQFAWGLFGMFMGFTNLGCRFIAHHHLDWVHPGFLILTLLYVLGFGPRVVQLALRARNARRAGGAIAAGALAVALSLFASSSGVRADGLPAAVPPPAAGPLFATLTSACGPAARLTPVHGTVTARTAGGLRANLDAVPSVRPAGPVTATLLSERDAAKPLRAGDPFDAELVSCAARRGSAAFLDAHRAGAYVAGVPDQAPVEALAAGGALPSVALVDQDGRPFDLANSSGKILLLSFAFTRCPDRNICPAISGKFSYMQHHLDPAKYRLALVTLDPPFDSPAVLKAYGRQFDADPARWSLLTGEGNDIKHLLERFGLTALADRPGRYVHDDELVIVRPDATIDRIVDTAGWNPNDAMAQAQTLGGDSSNPLRRLELASISDLAALCGGGQSVGVVVLDSIVFVLGVVILGSVLVWWGRQIFVREA